MNEYPIYSFELLFSDNGWSLRGHRTMLPDVPADPEIERAAWADRNLDTDREAALHSSGLPYKTLREAVDDGALEILETSWEFLGYDTWCCQWFSHYTFATHLSDEELLDSFAEFVKRHRGHDRWPDEERDEYHARVEPIDRVCLMAAEDRWRWEGPCRCEDCQKLGVVRFNH